MKICILLTIVVATGACSANQGAMIPEQFFSRSIQYDVETDAGQEMRKIRVLQSYNLSEDISEEEKEKAVATLYRNADDNRDYVITAEEAKRFRKIYTLEFEDKLGRAP